MKLSHFAVYQKLTQYCKSTILQLKKKKKPKFTADKLILASYHSSLSKYFMWDLAAKYKVQLLWRKSQDFFQICSLWDRLLLQFHKHSLSAAMCEHRSELWGFSSGCGGDSRPRSSAEHLPQAAMHTDLCKEAGKPTDTVHFKPNLWQALSFCGFWAEPTGSI